MFTVKSINIDLSKVNASQVIPTDTYFRVKDKGAKNNPYPDMFVVKCEYQGNPKFIFVATKEEVAQMKTVETMQVEKSSAVIATAKPSDIQNQIDALKTQYENLRTFVIANIPTPKQ